MLASPTLTLFVYCLAIACFSLVGGLLPGWVKMTHTRTQMVMSLVSGLMLGVAFYHLLPHSIVLSGPRNGIDNAVWWVMVGLITMFLLLRMFHFHQHDFSSDEEGHHDHAHPHHHEPAAHRLSWVGIALGLALHTLIDGVALGAVMLGEGHGHSTVSMAGFGVFLAILLHKPLDAMSITTIMEAGGWDRTARATTNVLFALMCPLGAVLFYFGVDMLTLSRDAIVAAVLAFSAGAFICIALSDLLPEVHFHSHDRGKLTLAFLLGIVIAYAIGAVEPAAMHHG
ncbi:ZIP family metal transporter [Pseudohalioglobus lutimaris]|nr:ZIP family metal transporter [Pseudohalioglobus lutimaris]